MRHEKIEYKSIEDLIPYARNQRIHSDEQVKKIAASIKEFGFKNPVIVDKEGTIIAGHGRCLAAEKLKIKELPVIVADDLNASQVKALRLADNKLQDLSEFDDELVRLELEELKGLDFDINLTGFDDLIDINSLDELDDERLDEVPEAPKEPRTKQGDLYIIDGKHRVLCGDSTKEEDVKRLMGGDKAKLWLTDPPYNVGLGMNETIEEAKKRNRRTDGKVVTNDLMGNDEFLNFLVDVFTAAGKNIDSGAPFYIWHADTEGLNFRLALKESGLLIRQCLVWVKSSLVMGRQDYHWRHEPCLYGWKEGSAHFWGGDRKQSTVLEFEKPSRSDQHPTMKPLNLFEYQIKNSSALGALVLDTFLGSGTTLIACEKTNRKCYGIEIDPIYCDVIIQRYKDLKPEAKIELNGECIDW